VKEATVDSPGDGQFIVGATNRAVPRLHDDRMY
jgi:hypothetical protein